MLNKQNIKDIYPLSPMQESMLFHSLMEPGSSAYFEQMSFLIKGDFNAGIFGQSIDFLLKRHDILRTLFVHKNVSRPFQVVLKEAAFKVEEKDLSSFSKENREQIINEIKEKDKRRSFQLSTELLLRIQLLKLKDDEYQVIWSHHHILMDGWCMGIIVKEFLEVYRALITVDAPVLPPVTPFNSYIKWLEKQDKENSLNHWRSRLSDVEVSTSFAGGQKNPSSAFIKTEIKKILPQDLKERLVSLSAELGITQNSCLQAMWGFLLAKMNYTDKAVFGVVVSGRPAEITNVGSILGLFINTIPFKVDLSEGSTVKEFLLNVQRSSNASLGHEYIPLADIQNQSGLSNQLFDHLFIYENFPAAVNSNSVDKSKYGFGISDIETYEQTNYDLNVVVVPTNGRLEFKYDFNAAVYSASAIETLHQRLEKLLLQVVENVERPLKELDILIKNDRVVLETETTTIAKTVIDIIDEKCKTEADKIALEFEGIKLTYRELQQKSNALAQILMQEYGIAESDIVALYLDRSPEAVIAILAVLKAGALYVPIDKSNPEERISFILKDCRAKLVLTDEEITHQANCLNLKKLNYGNTVVNINNTKLNGRAYIIYTSGSTGNPKGCELSHENLANYIDWSSEYYPAKCGASGNVPLYTSLSFDLTITSIFLPLITGSTLTICSKEITVEETLKSVFTNPSIDLVKITPAHISLLAYSGVKNSKVKGAIVGGEELKQNHVEILKSIAPGIIIFNEYGPTETTVGCSVKMIRDPQEEINIGKAIRNMDLLIVDKSLNALPAGAVGEIVILGTGVGAGYLNRAELSAEKFISLHGKKAYRSGDLGKQLPGGEFQFLGRIDDQVKIRGYRVEPGEIEKHLLSLKKIKEACVLAVKNEFLAAYISSDDEISIEALKEELGKALPAYMVPDRIMQVPRIPLTPNGKVDRKSLLSIEIKDSIAYEAPVTETEKQLVQIWKEILHAGQIGRTNNFFQLGGHSLKITILSSLIVKQFKKEISIKRLYGTPVLKDQAQLIEQKEEEEIVSIVKAAPQEYYPLSFAQNRLYILHRLDPESTAYNIPAFLHIKGNLDVEKVRSSFEKIFQKHEVFRTSFHLINDTAVQKIHEKTELDFEYLEVKTGDPIPLIQQMIRPFDLSKAPLLRLKIIKKAKQEYILGIDMHHIVSDGVSMALLVDEFKKLYAEQETEAAVIQYKDFAAWQQKYSQTEKFNAHRKYWLDQFSDLPEPLLLPYTGTRPEEHRYVGATQNFSINKEFSKEINGLITKNDLSLFMFMLGAFKLLIYKYSRQKDLVVGVPVSGRTHPDIQKTLGVFINTLAVRTKIIDEYSFDEFAAQLKGQFLEAMDHQDFPFEYLVEELKLQPDLSRNPLFDVMFILQNTGNDVPVMGDVELYPLENADTSSKFDLTLIAAEAENGININIEYNTDLFDRAFIERFFSHYLQLLRGIVKDSGKALKDYSLLGKEEEQVLLSSATGELPEQASTETLITLFRKNFDEKKNKKLLFVGDNSYTCNELDLFSDRIAAELLALGVQKEEVVGIKLGRGLEFIASMLGVMKAGAAYVAIDVNYPVDRQAYIISDSGARVIIGNNETLGSLPENVRGLNYADLDFSKKPDSTDHSKHDGLAYIIYTSGSTGMPKGVAIEHGNAAAFLAWAEEEFGDDAYEVVFAGTSFSFDLSIFEIFYHLSAGKKIRLLESGLTISEYLGREKNILLNTVPSVISDLQNSGADFSNVYAINMAGEPISSGIKNRLDYKKIKVRNLYGPSEDTTYSTFYELKEADDRQVIGKAISGTKAYVMNEHLQLLPAGVPGELYLSGAGVARGYLNKEDITKERFLPDPFTPGQRIYKTGDLVRWNEDWNLEYLGRLDNQVKIRGYRIELGEIESVLANEFEFKEVAVAANKINNELQLGAYIVSDNTIDENEIKNKLAKRLPAYMIPLYFVQLDKLPLTSNGKTDKRKLPLPQLLLNDKTRSKPITQTEEKLALLWSEVLGTGQVYREDNFFLLGGHSLKATVLAAKLIRIFHVQLAIKDIFKNPVLSQMAALIDQQEQTSFSVIPVAAKKPHYSVSSSQKRIFVLQQLEPESVQYNMSYVLTLKGNVDLEKIDRAFKTIVVRHESLRTNFDLVNGEPVQLIHENINFKIDIEQRAEWDNKILEEFVRPYDLKNDVLFRIKIVKATDINYLLFDIHHILFDGYSIKNFTSEFIKAYNETELDKLEIQYKDFSEWQNGLFNSAKLINQKNYWLEKFENLPEPLGLPTDYKRPALQSYSGSELKFELPSGLSQKIEQLAGKSGTTLFNVLLAAYYILLHKYSHKKDLVVGTPVSGRTYPGLEALIGVFINTLALRNEVGGSFNEFLEQVHANNIDAFDRQDYPFEELLRSLDLKRDLSRTPLFETMFSIEDTDNSNLELEDVEIGFLDSAGTTAKFDITLIANPGKENISFKIEYCTDLFTAEYIGQFFEHYKTILEKASDNSQIEIAELNVLSEKESSRFANEFNNYAPAEAVDFINVFEKNLQKFNSNVAGFDKIEYTYRDLDNRANEIANELKKGGKEKARMGVFLNPGFDLVATVLGIWKSGNCYVPLDVNYPAERIEFILRDAEINTVISSGATAAKLKLKDAEILLLEKVKQDQQFVSLCRADAEAYIIYTSGSTGQPKGVLIRQCQLAGKLRGIIKLYDFSPELALLRVTNPTFDVSLLELFMPLFAGGKTVFPALDKIHEHEYLLELCNQNCVSDFQCTPSFLDTFIDVNKFNGLNRSTLRNICVGGESLTASLVSKVKKYLPQVQLNNHYGPTETTIDAIIEKDVKQFSQNIIGRPMPDNFVTLLDENGKPVPIGVTGEICIGGQSVSSGYLNREAENKKAFTTIEFKSRTENLYRTGDLGKWTRDGKIEFFGRKDDQVKIRGHRIEPGEVENQISAVEGVGQVAVMAVTVNNAKALCAYIVGEVDQHHIVNAISKKIPSYMIPAHFVFMKQLPLNKNGKVDRKLLPAPNYNAVRTVKAPRSEKEGILSTIFKQVLGLEQISTDDDFFALGGDSIKAIQVSSRFGNKGYKIQVKDIFENPSIEKLALKAKEKAVFIDQSPVEGAAPLTAIQEYFLNHSSLDKNHYNQSLLLHAQNGFDLQRLQTSLEKLVHHHDALRMVVSEGKLFNKLSIDVELPAFDLTKEKDHSTKITSICAEQQQNINIEKGPLFKFVAFKTTAGDYLALIFHHLIIDGVSWRVLLEDLHTLYGSDVALPLKTNSFIQWAAEINEYAFSDSINKTKSYWTDLNSEIRIIFPEKNKEKGLSSRRVVFDADFAKALLTTANQKFNTRIHELLIASLAKTIGQLKGETKIPVSLEGHGREPVLPQMDISRTVGWFTSEYPVLIDVAQDDFKSVLINTKEHLRNIPNNGIDHGILKYLRKDELKDALTPQVIFNYLGDFTQETEKGSFTISDISTGSNQAKNNPLAYALEINSFISGNGLQLDLEFDKKYFTEKDIQDFISVFKEITVQLRDFCMSGDAVLTPADFALNNISFPVFEKIISKYPAIEDIYPLSPMQQGMLFENLRGGRSNDAYFEQSIVEIKGDLKKEKIEEIYNQLIARHQVLRSNIVYDGLEEPLSVISKEKFGTVIYKDLSALNKKEQEKAISSFMAMEKEQGYDLGKDLLMTISLFKTGKENYKILWTHHHILIDGWCLGILLNEFFQFYNESYERLMPVTPYSKYISWLKKQDKAGAEAYWNNLLGDYDAAARIPGYKKSVQEQPAHFETTELVLTEKLQKQITAFTKNNQLTVFNTIQTIWGILLQKYNSRNEVVFGSVISGRPADLEGVENMVGLFINSIPVKVGRAGSFLETAKVLQEQFNNSNNYGYLPLNEIQNLSPLKADLVNHLLIYESYPLDERSKAINQKKSSLMIEGIESKELTNYDFTLTILPTDNLTILFDYNKNVYDPEFMLMLRNSFVTVMEQVLSDPGVHVKNIALCDEGERTRLLALNPAAVENENSSFSGLFQKAVNKYAGNIALKYNKETMTYAELDARSNRIANSLIAKGVQKNDVVAIFARPCFEMMEGILGIIKSGAAYLPLDLEYPAERIEYMLDDSAAKYILSTEDNLAITGKEILNLFDDSWKLNDVSAPAVNVSAKDSAYIIYTSGSTGKPKGVLISQESFVDYVEFAAERFSLTEKDMLLQHASIAFDTTIEELYPILSVGGTIVFPENKKDFNEMLDHIAAGEVTIFCTSPLVLNFINEENRGLGKLRLITVGGEELKSTHVDRIIDKVDVWNGYGPTESTVCATFYKVKANVPVIPIGKPFRNREVYIVNHDLNLLPKEIAGELCIGGKGLAIKYLNQPELTAEKFIENPFAASGKIYRTGDLAKWKEDNDLDFLGRIDSQIQVRGFRVELGEVENLINKIPGVREAVVLAFDDAITASKYLCAYISGDIKEEEIKLYLSRELPEYMVPSRFIQLEKLPLTTNGKVDRKALPKPEINLAAEAVALPEDQRQEMLLNVWKQVLKQENIGIDSNFFSLGGDSIKAIQLSSRMRAHNLKLDIKDIFTYPTVRQLTPFLQESKIIAEQGLIQGQYPLTPIQKMFFHEKLEYKDHYNQAVMLFVENRMEKSILEDSLKKLIAHHDALRTRFILSENEMIQDLAKDLISFKVHEFELEQKETIEQKAQELQGTLNIEEGKLIVSGLFHTRAGTHILLAIHHLVVDGVSWRIILEDLGSILKGDELPAKTQSFKSWSLALQEHAESNGLKKELPYWKGILENYKPAWSKQTDNAYKNNSTAELELDAEQTAILLTKVNTAYNTEINDLLLAALGMSLQKLLQRPDNIIFLEGHGREELFEAQDLSRTVGWFTTIFPVQLKMTSEQPGEIIKQTKESLRKIPNKGIGYGLLRSLNKEVAASGELDAVPEITFNYLGQFEKEQENDQIRISDFSPGYAVNQQNQKEGVIDVNGIVVNGKMKIEVTYNPMVTPAEKITDFIQDYKNNLLALTEHCLSKENSELTASDFQTANLSNEELDDIMQMMDDL